MSKKTIETVARAIGMKASEVLSVNETDEGTVIVTSDGQSLVDVPVDRPDADGKTGLMFLSRPNNLKNAITFPVYARTAVEADEDVEADAAPGDDPLAPIRELIDQAVDDGDFADVDEAVAAIVERLTAPEEEPEPKKATAAAKKAAAGA